MEYFQQYSSTLFASSLHFSPAFPSHFHDMTRHVSAKQYRLQDEENCWKIFFFDKLKH